MISLSNLIGKKDKGGEADKAAEDRSNIFGKALNVGQIVKSKKARYIEGKNRKKAYATLGAGFVILVSYSVLFFYGNAVAYLKAPAQIAALQSETREYNEVILPSLEKTRSLHKAAYDQEFEDVIKTLDTVFPKDIDKLGMIRLLESFATEVAATFPPFEFTAINLANPQPTASYQIIPVSTTIHSSLAGFDRFLSLVDRSGYIYIGEEDNKRVVETKIRLMSISNISINYRGVDEATGQDQGVDFTVKLNIYSRMPDAPSKPAR